MTRELAARSVGRESVYSILVVERTRNRSRSSAEEVEDDRVKVDVREDGERGRSKSDDDQNIILDFLPQSQSDVDDDEQQYSNKHEK